MGSLGQEERRTYAKVFNMNRGTLGSSQATVMLRR